MENSIYGFGFPGVDDILSNCYGKGDHAVYARADCKGIVYLETNGGPFELITVGEYYKACRDGNAAEAIVDLSARLINAGRVDLAEFIGGNLALCGRGDLAKIIAYNLTEAGCEKLAKTVRCLIDRWGYRAMRVHD